MAKILTKSSSAQTIKTRASLGVFLMRALPVLIIVLSVENYIGQRFLIGGDDQVDRCLPDKRIYIIDTFNKDVWRGI